MSAQSNAQLIPAAGGEREAQGVPWEWFWSRVHATRSLAELRATQSDTTGVMRAVHDILHAALPAPPSDDVIGKAFAVAWSDVAARVAAGDELADRGGKTLGENMRRLAWERVEAYAPRRTVYARSLVEDGRQRWYTLHRLFTGQAKAFIADERVPGNGGVQDLLTVIAFASDDGNVGARVRVPHPLAGCAVAVEPPDGYEGGDPGRASDDNDPPKVGSLGDELSRLPRGDESFVMRVSLDVDEDLLVEGEPAQRFLAEQGAVIVVD